MKQYLQEDKKITFSERVRVGFGNGGTSFAQIMYSSLAMYYFTDILGIGAAAAGILMLIAKIWDGVNDPMMGVIVDKTETKYGKTRPYIFAGGILLAIFSFLLFFNPGLKSNVSKIIWAAFTYIGWDMAFTCYVMALRLLPTRMTKDRNEYANMSAAGMLGSTVVAIFASAFLMKMISFFSGDSGNMGKGYAGTALVAAALVLIATLSASTIKERNFGREEKKSEKSDYSLIEAVVVLVKNRPFMGFCICSAVVYIGYYLASSTLMYYCIYNLGSADKYTPLMLLDYGTPIITAITIPYVIKKVDKKNLIKISFLFIAAGYGLRYITGDSNLYVMLILAAVAGLALGYWNIMFTPVSIDCAIYSEYTSGKKMDGLFVSAFTLLTKVAAGIGGAALGFLLENAGYMQGAETQTQEVLNVLRFCATGGAALAAIIGFVLFCLTYKLKNEDLEQMSREIEARKTVQ